MRCRESRPEPAVATLPHLRFEVPEAARILRISRAQLYNRLQEGSLKCQKDGARTYITCAELERYVESCNPLAHSSAREDRRLARRGYEEGDGPERSRS